MSKQVSNFFPAKGIIALLLALTLAFSLTACGHDPTSGGVSGSLGGAPNGNDTPSDEPSSGGDVAGATQGFGDFAAILVPEGFTFVRDSWNEDNPHFVSVKKSDWTYFDFHNYTDEESMRKNYTYNRNTYTNEQVDVSANYGGMDWNGFQYSDGFGGYGFEVITIIGSNYLQVSSAGLTFDSEIAQSVLGSVVMADSGDTPGDEETSGVDRTDTEVGGGYHGSLEWLRYWSGDWYGWWLMTNGTGLYADVGEGTGRGVWDACARIEAYEDTTGYMELWDSDGSYSSLIACIDLSFANPDDTEYGVMECRGGQFFSDMLENGAWYVNPDELAYENIFEFRGDYEDAYGTFSYRVVLRPWGTLWGDLGKEYYPEYYDDWYLPLVASGSSMPDYIG